MLEKLLYYNDFWRITEDWSNDAKKSALQHRNKLHCKIYDNEKLLN